MTQEEKRKEAILVLLRRVHDLRFDIQLTGLNLRDEELVAAAEILTPLLPLIGSKLYTKE
jgi:hypothetical protein